jgi:hypothetical protein
MAKKKKTAKRAVTSRLASSRTKRKVRMKAATAAPVVDLHQLFQRQAEVIIAESDASEDEKLQMLLAMNCPCCGLGGSSFSIKLKREPGPSPQRRFFADEG